MFLGLVFALSGLLVLSVAADQFVKGAARLAVGLKVAPVVVGAVVVGFGTSAPEMVVSGLAALEGQLEIGVGNIVGSNVANVSLVLGVSALFGTLVVGSDIIRKDALSSVAAVTAFAIVLQNGLEIWEGVLLILVLLIWLWVVVRGARTGGVVVADGNVSDIIGNDDDSFSVWLESLRIAVGLAFVIGAAYVLVDGAERIAEALNLSGGLVGYTLIAVGTSAPELVTAIMAVRRGETELLVGNLLGSNVFNSLAVGGIISLLGAGAAGSATMIDTGAMIDANVQAADATNLETLGAGLMVFICFASWAAMAIGQQMTRVKGALLVVMWLTSVLLLA